MSELYDPQAAREYARNDESVTAEQRANLLAYADAFEARARGRAFEVNAFEGGESQ